MVVVATSTFKAALHKIHELVCLSLIVNVCLFVFVLFSALKTKMELKFNNVSVEVAGKLLLSGTCGSARPGELLAIMGPSGKADI